MVSEAQRTLVKSPPELWAELSDPVSLARHLSELGEIRITASEPEREVRWEGESIAGTVTLAPSGWGTKVTLTAIRELAEPEPSLSETEPESSLAEPQPSSEPAPRPDPAPEPEPEPEPEPIVAYTPEPDPIEEFAREEQTSTESRRGFFSRLFRRRRAQPAAAEVEAEIVEVEPLAPIEPAEVVKPEPVTSLEPEVVEPEPDATLEPETKFEPEATLEPEQPQPNLAAELAAAEELITDQTTAVLTAVLDRLGAAHHRPFSRA